MTSNRPQQDADETEIVYYEHTVGEKKYGFLRDTSNPTAWMRSTVTTALER
jgi:hypothetical protein